MFFFKLISHWLMWHVLSVFPFILFKKKKQMSDMGSQLKHVTSTSVKSSITHF